MQRMTRSEASLCARSHSTHTCVMCVMCVMCGMAPADFADGAQLLDERQRLLDQLRHSQALQRRLRPRTLAHLPKRYEGCIGRRATPCTWYSSGAGKG